MQTMQNILVATDFSALGEHAVETAFSLAEQLGSTVHVMHVFTLQGEAELARLPPQALREAEQRAARRLQALADEARPASALGRVIMRNGDPAPMILLTSEDVVADLIVVGTHGRRGLGRLLMGSTAESVLRQARCPVMVVKQPEKSERAQGVSKQPASAERTDS